MEFKTVQVEYTNNVKITTSVNPNVSDVEIKNYFRVGSIVNVGNGEYDRMEKILNVNILK
jgi:hypothetical protein